MSFINKSVTFSQTILLRKLLAQVLNSVNEYYYNASKTTKPFENDTYHVIPNNGVKYYMFIVNKNCIEQGKNSYNLLYFFQNDNTDQNFCIEINNMFNETLLLEGYLYNTCNSKKHFMVTDVLFKNNTVLQNDYKVRHALLNDLIKPMIQLNDYITVSIHNVLQNDNEKMINIMFHNFIYNKQLCFIEKVYKFTKINFKTKTLVDEKCNKELKVVVKSNLPDVYVVKNISTCTKEGILYIKGLEESMKLHAIFKNVDTCQIQCIFNNKFYKWQPVF